MKIDFPRDRNGRLAVEVADAPPFVRGLAASPAEREAFLDTGNWLVLSVAVWSGPDLSAIEPATAVVSEFDGGISLGIRPFDEFEELSSWLTRVGVAERSPRVGAGQPLVPAPAPWPTLRAFQSPVWVLFREGQVVDCASGLLSESMLRLFLRQVVV
jgi:hypothetical protein